MMGLTSSPYVNTKGQLLATEVVLGDRHDPGNLFRWEKVIPNLPGSEHCEPRFPRLWKAQDADSRRLVVPLVQYVDDLQVAGSTEVNCWGEHASDFIKIDLPWDTSGSKKNSPP